MHGTIMSKSQQIHPVLSLDVYRRAKAYAARRGMALGAITEEALRQYLDQSGDVALILGRLDRNGRDLDRLKRDLELLSEFLSVFVRMWFAHTPQIVESEREAAQRIGARRYEQMLDFVSKRISSGHRLVEDLAGEALADDKDLAAMAARGVDGARHQSE
jgi:hypothetical protein